MSGARNATKAVVGALGMGKRDERAVTMSDASALEMVVRYAGSDAGNQAAKDFLATLAALRSRVTKLEGHRNDWRRRAFMARDLLERAAKLVAASNGDHPMLDEIDGCLSAMLADDEAQRTPHGSTQRSEKGE